MKTCNECGAEITLDSLFCPKCGTKQSVAEVPQAAPAVIVEEVTVPTVSERSKSMAAEQTEKPSKRGKRIVAIVRNSIILAVALLLLIGSFFPVNSITIEGADIGLSDAIEGEFDVHLNVFQYITLFADSLYEVKDSDDLADLDDRMDEIAIELEKLTDEDLDDLSPKAKRLLSEMFFVMMRGLTRSNVGGPSVSLVLSAVFGIFNILFCVALFVIALLNLLATFNVLNALKGGKTRLYAWTLGLLTAAPAVILATHYAGHLFIGSGGLSALAVWSLIAIAATVVTTMVFRYIFSKKDTVRNIVARSVAMTLSIVVLCLAFAPSFSASIKCENSRRAKVYHGAEFFEDLAISEEEGEYLEDLLSKNDREKKNYFAKEMEYYARMSKKEFQSLYGTILSSSLAIDLLGSSIEAPFLNFYSVAVIFFIITVICVLVILWQSLYFFTTGKHVKRIVVITKICAAVAAAVALIWTIALVISISLIANDYIDSGYSVRIGAGVITMAIFAIGAIFCPSGLVKKVKKVKPSKQNRVYEDVGDLF